VKRKEEEKKKKRRKKRKMEKTILLYFPYLRRGHQFDHVNRGVQGRRA
jgi:hypothetical protein